MGLLELKYRRLMELVKRKGSVVVAYSGGVDSSLLAAVAYKTLGGRATAVTLKSPTMPARELREARNTAKAIGIRHVVLRHSELSSSNFVKNTLKRCYYCKRMLSKALRAYASKHRIKAVLEGTNATEIKGHRPGYEALRKSGVSSPLAEAGLAKLEVRALARRLGLPNHCKPSAACLSSRIPYRTRISRRLLRTVESAEDYLINLGVLQVRVRCFGEMAVIEALPSDFQRIMKNRCGVERRFRALGFKRVAVDLAGYRTGSMNPLTRFPRTPRSRPRRIRPRGSR